MAMGKWLLCASIGLASASLVVSAAPTTGPATRPAEPAMGVKLVKPYSMLKDLTPEQTAQIYKIHHDFLEEQKKLEAKQKDDIIAVLTPAQQAELLSMEVKTKAEMKIKSVEKKKMATTEPAE